MRLLIKGLCFAIAAPAMPTSLTFNWLIRRDRWWASAMGMLLCGLTWSGAVVAIFCPDAPLGIRIVAWFFAYPLELGLAMLVSGIVMQSAKRWRGLCPVLA